MFTLSEDSIKALHARLENNLNGFVDQVNQSLTEPDFPLEYPKNVYDFIPTRAYLTDFPTVAIGDGTINFEDDTGWSATGDMDFAVVVWVQAMDQRQLAWWLRRYMVAVSNCILEGRSLAFEGGGWGIRLNSIEPGPTLGRRDSPHTVVGMRAMTFSVRDEQDA